MKKLEEIYSKENIKKLLNKDASLEELNEFDLKLEMRNNIELKTMYDEQIKKYSKIDYAELFDYKHILERYLVYKKLNRIKYTFDCDKLPFVKKMYEVNKDTPCDTIFSIQSIYSRIMSKDSFLKQLESIDQLKHSPFYNDICRLIIYYHTIGNMCPCPNKNNYNVSKCRQNPNGFDRLDLFKKTAYFKECHFEDFFSESTLEKYCLKEIYEGNKLPNLEDTNKIFSDDQKDINKIKNYINIYINLIIDRTDKIYQKKN